MQSKDLPVPWLPPRTCRHTTTNNTKIGESGSGGFVPYCAKLYKDSVPDFNYTTEEYLHIKCEKGDSFIHIGTYSGIPTKPNHYMPIDPPTGKGFCVMGIDIHHVENQKLKATWHVEDWLD